MLFSENFGELEDIKTVFSVTPCLRGGIDRYAIF